MPDSSRNDDDLERQLAETERARQEAEERWTAGLANFATQLEEAFERGRVRGWAECARHFGLPLAPAGRHRQRRHLSAVPGGVAGVAAFTALRLAGSARTVTSAGAAFARHAAAHSTAAAVTVAAAGVTVVAGGVTVALAPSTTHASAAPPPAAASLAPAAAVTPPAALWPPERQSAGSPAGVTVNSAAPAVSPPPAVPVTAVPVIPGVPATQPIPTDPDVPTTPDVPTVPAVPDIPPVQISTPVTAIAEAAAPVRRRLRQAVNGIGQAVGGYSGPGDDGHHHGGLPVRMPSVPPHAIPVPPVSLPPVLGGHGRR